MRILLLSQFFDPEPTLKGLAFAKALAALGHEVEVLTGFPNYPGGKVYEGYRVKLYQRETVDGIRIHRVALYPSHDRSARRRVANYVSFALSAAILGPWLIRKLDAVYVHHPPLTISWPARMIRLFRGAPFVYEIQDIWPDTLGATGMLSKPWLLRFIGSWARRVYRSADHIVVISKGFRRLLIERGVPEEKIDVLYNWSEEGRLQPERRSPDLARELGLQDRFTVMFAGTMGFAQGLDAVLEAAQILKDRNSEVQFVLVGGGVESDRLKEYARQLALRDIVFVPRQPMERMGSILALADALLVHLRDDPLFEITVPSKTQAYMRVGIPIVMAVRGDAANLVREAKAGITCEPCNPQSIADAIGAVAEMSPTERAAMGAAGRDFYDRELSLDVGVRKYDAIFRKLAGEVTG